MTFTRRDVGKLRRKSRGAASLSPNRRVINDRERRCCLTPPYVSQHWPIRSATSVASRCPPTIACVGYRFTRSRSTILRRAEAASRHCRTLGSSLLSCLVLRVATCLRPHSGRVTRAPRESASPELPQQWCHRVRRATSGKAGSSSKRLMVAAISSLGAVFRSDKPAPRSVTLRALSP